MSEQLGPRPVSAARICPEAGILTSCRNECPVSFAHICRFLDTNSLATHGEDRQAYDTLPIRIEASPHSTGGAKVNRILKSEELMVTAGENRHAGAI